MSKEAYFVRDLEDAGTIQYKNTSATAVAIGEVVNVSIGANQGMVAVALQAIAGASGDTTHSGTCAYTGTYDLANGSKSFSVGDVVKWNTSTNACTDATSTGIYNAGLCVRKSDSTADSFVTTDLNAGPKAYYVY